MHRLPGLLAALLLAFLPALAAAEEPDTGEPRLTAKTFAGLELRSIGPAMKSGRVVDVVPDPEDRGTWYVAAASGGVWKTVNAGTTWTPIFDRESSYSIGCITLDPANSQVVWVGTGENNSQRSAGYGDGVYRSRDGGESWKNVGLAKSEHVGRIVVDPRDSNAVYVAAQGPLWAPGGDRGLYKTVDGGETWTRVLEISGDTGVSDVAFDPRDPDVLYAASYQRRRRQWALVAGGPESAVYKSVDAGATWRKLGRGLPDGVDVGRIGLAVSPHDADAIYALFNNHKSGDFNAYVLKSADRGRTWASIADGIPERHVAWSLAEDHERADLLFLGTEFGLFFSLDGQWIQLEGGLPTVAFKDLEIQRREHDLVAASFGRGFFILDDYTPLRRTTRETLEQEAVLFPVKKTWMYLPSSPLGSGEKDVRGHAFFTAPNPPFGAVFTYYLKDSYETLRKKRHDAEDAIKKEGGDVFYPYWEDLRAEELEEKPAVILTVTDEEGHVVRRLTGPHRAGFHRVAWDRRGYRRGRRSPTQSELVVRPSSFNWPSIQRRHFGGGGPSGSPASRLSRIPSIS